MELSTGDIHVAKEKEHNRTITLYYFHVGWHSVFPSVATPLSALVVCATAFSTGQRTRSSIGETYGSHMHQQ